MASPKTPPPTKRRHVDVTMPSVLYAALCVLAERKQLAPASYVRMLIAEAVSEAAEQSAARKTTQH